MSFMEFGVSCNSVYFVLWNIRSAIDYYISYKEVIDIVFVAPNLNSP